MTKTLVSSVHGLAKGTTVAGKYRILEEIGRGGMGIVYKAEDINLRRTVALKFLLFQWISDPEARERFIHEARAASALDHPNICTIYEIGETEDGRMFIAMGCYEGESLREKLRRGPMKAEDALGVATQVALGMEKAHGKGIIHRDIKPANILITNDGVAKIVDFGLAKLAGQVKLTREGTTIGTVAYMSPEQARGDAIDQRTDIWSLGVVLYEMLSGRLPFKGYYEQSLIHSILNTDPESIGKIRKDLPKGLESIVLKTLAKDPNARYQGTDEVLEDLKAVSTGVKPLGAKAGLFQGKVLGIRKIYAYSGLACLAILASISVFNVGAVRNILIGKPKEATIRSLAVLPLSNYSGDPNQEYFSDGMTDELITNLSKISALKVICRTSVMRFKRINKPLREIAAELGVDAVIEGSVSRAGNRVRIIARLIDPSTNSNLWTDSYERELSGVLALQSEVAQAIASEVRAELTPQEQARLASARPVNPEVYELCLKGWHFRYKDTPEGFQKAVEYFQRAIDLDAAYALAYAGLSEGYFTAALYNVLPFKDALSKARAAAKRAVELDESLAEAHALLGGVTQIDWDWVSAEREYKRAIELNPNSEAAQIWYGWYLTCMGRFDEAITNRRRAVALNPLSVPANDYLGWTLFYAGRYEESIRQYHKVLELDPKNAYGYMWLSRSYVANSQPTEAAAASRKALELAPEDFCVLTYCGHDLSLLGNRQEALALLERVMALSKQKSVDPLLLAYMYIGLGDKERALELLEQAVEEHSPNIMGDLNLDFGQALDTEPRYQALRRRMNLAATEKK